MHTIFTYNYLCEEECLFLRVGNRLADNFPKLSGIPGTCQVGWSPQHPRRSVLVEHILKLRTREGTGWWPYHAVWELCYFLVAFPLLWHHSIQRKGCVCSNSSKVDSGQWVLVTFLCCMEGLGKVTSEIHFGF